MKQVGKAGLAFCLLLASAAAGPVATAGESRKPEDGQWSLREPVRKECRREVPEWLEPLAFRWRQEFETSSLSRYLFQQPLPAETSAAPEDPGPAAAADGGASPPPASGLGRDSCERGDESLRAGLAPEAFGHYRICVDSQPADPAARLRGRVGLLKANLMMGRFEEASRQLEELKAAGQLEQDPLLPLLEGILASLRADFGEAAGRFLACVPDWPRCTSLPLFAGGSLLRQRRYQDARNVFRVASHDAWKPVREFALVGLADAERGLDRCEEAEAVYRRLADRGSPPGVMGLAEHRILQGDLGGASACLRTLTDGEAGDYWKGIAITYRVILCAQRKEWPEAEQLAWRSESFVIGEPWRTRVREATVEVVSRLFKEMTEKGEDLEAILLAERWRNLVPALPAESLVLLAEAWDRLGLAGMAIEFLEQIPGRPETLYEAALLACLRGDNERAQGLLERVAGGAGPELSGKKEMLEALVNFRLQRLEEAKQLLAVRPEDPDPRLLPETGRARVALDMPLAGAEDYRRALELTPPDASGPSLLLRERALLLYRHQTPEAALESLGRAGQETAADSGTSAEPAEVLSLLKLRRFEQARERLGRVGDRKDKQLLEELAAADSLLESLKGNADGF